MLSTLVAIIGTYAISAPFLGEVADCGKNNGAIFTINSLSLDPVAPVSGQNLTLYLEYSVPDGITIVDGTAEYDVSWNFIPLEPTTEPLCQDIPCPLGPGRYTNHSMSVWPADISGYISSQMRWYDVSKALLLCVEIQGQAGDPREVAIVASPAKPQPSMRPLQVHELPSAAPPQPSLDHIVEVLMGRPSVRLVKRYLRSLF